MNIETYSDSLILSDLVELEKLFALKRVIRYTHERQVDDPTESVAEHVYGMHVLCDYFLSLEDEAGHLRRGTISTMITFHDIDEIETGDVLGYLKTDVERAAEAEAMRRVIASVPENLKLVLINAINEYEQQVTREAKFVKALDKLEPIVHLYNERGKRTLHSNKTTVENSYSIKVPHVTEFPFMSRFLTVTHEHLEQQGFFFSM